MSGYSDLIDVKFVDNTTYATSTSGDVLGVVMPWYWGPANKLVTYNQQQFFHYFPESLPTSSASANASISALKDTYVQIKRYFESGGTTVSLYRPSREKILVMPLFRKDGGAATASAISIAQSATLQNAITVKYPGIPPKSLVGAEEGLYVYMHNTATAKGDTEIDIKVYKNKADYDALNDSYEEHFECSLTAGLKDGMSVYIEDVLADSQYLSCVGTYSAPNVDSETFLQEDNYIDTLYEIYAKGGAYNDGGKASDMDAVSVLSDIEMCNATWILDNLSIATDRRCSISVSGYDTFPASVEDALKSKTTDVPSQFGVKVCGSELTTFAGEQVASNCVGAWIGHQCAKAQSVRINQCASARGHGAFAGTLLKSMTFDDVQKLHAEGVCSVYQTATGAFMFGVHTTYSRQTSYYAKLNVMRVVTRLLRDVFPSFISAIHTDTASNEITRTTFGIALQSIVDEYIADQNLRPQSRVIVDETVNNDFTTKSGTQLNAKFELWFLGLVEKVKITIQAADSTVTANIE